MLTSSFLAGGNSVNSEACSFELLYRLFRATLCRTETELRYWPTGSKITDYEARLFDMSIGVSVTRAMRHRGVFGPEDARRLLEKKLLGVVESSANVVDGRFHKQVLHVWTRTRHAARVIQQEHRRMSQDLRANTVVLVTVVKNANWIFYEKPAPKSAFSEMVCV